MNNETKNWRIYRSKSGGVMIEYHDASGKLLLALKYQSEQVRQLANQLLSAAGKRHDKPPLRAI